MTGSLTYPQININYDPDATCDHGCIPCIYGCTNSIASNYNYLATCDDGSCLICVYGCTDPLASNYDPLATCDDGSCQPPCVWGCTDNGDKDQYWWDTITNYATSTGIPTYPAAPNNFPLPNVFDPNNGACNFNPWATCDDGSCAYNFGCTDPSAMNYDSNACIDDGSCTACVYGCTDDQAINYNPSATCDDGSCTYHVHGCMDDGSFPVGNMAYINNMMQPNTNVTSNPTQYGSGTPGTPACNYDSSATQDDGSCYYEQEFEIGCPVLGCMDRCATNYDSTANTDDGSCYGTSNAHDAGGQPDCVELEDASENPTPYQYQFEEPFISPTHCGCSSQALKSNINYCWYIMNNNGPASSTVFHENDDWFWAGYGNPGGSASSFSKPLADKDDYLLSPCTHLYAGENYKVSFDYNVQYGGTGTYSGWNHHNISVKVYDDPGSNHAPITVPTLTAGVNYLSPHDFFAIPPDDQWYSKSMRFNVPIDGVYHIGFHLTSRQRQYRFDLDNVVIEKL